MKLLSKIKNYCSVALFVGATATVTLNSCTEKIDETDLYTFTGEMMIDHFENNLEVFSSYLTILGNVHMSKRSSSTMRELLAARGNYTCFAPTNEAIQEYLDSLYTIGQLESNQLDQISDSVAEAIVFNSIIQNGESEAFPTTVFTNGPLRKTNMNDRYISTSFSNDADNNTLIYVNINSLIIEGDIEVENGYIHTVDKVISPTNSTVADLLFTADNTTFFNNLLRLTGWNEKVIDYNDEEWADRNDDIRGTLKSAKFDGMYPESRKIGYTIFVETDDVFANHNITDLESLKQWVKANANKEYEDDTSTGHATSWGDDYTNDYNWLNQFVTYHILPEILTYNTMITFANELGRTAANMGADPNAYYTDFKGNVWEYWETIGVQRRSLKITACKDKDGVVKRYINRVSVYDNAYNGNYEELYADIEGIEISATNGITDNSALNGFYYPINDILIWNTNVPNKVLNERMRYDVTAMFPEFLTNKIRQQHSDYYNWYITPDYVANIVDMSNETDFFYLVNKDYDGRDGMWMDYQIDEFNINGSFDFTMKLPPVPYTGTYEIRYGVNANNNRGMAQVYLGTNKNNLPAIGIPLDLRESSGAQKTNTGWVEDPTSGDELEIQENTKVMRNLGFMKGPKYMSFDGGTGRTFWRCFRKIIYTGTLEAGKTYYIRFKSVLEEDAEFFYDYLEFVPKSVYAGEVAEDVW
ncbi:MAG: fasciclin domain-containing protein [Prevotellaceae bacterium]|nr:fasciclin domain-containing protein [Prevotellaceae bacterium]